MGAQKKDCHPAKGNSLLYGNRINGESNLTNKHPLNNTKERQEVALLKHSLVNGYSTYLKVVEALEVKFKVVNDGK